jgi:hypothetical protein
VSRGALTRRGLLAASAAAGVAGSVPALAASGRRGGTGIGHAAELDLSTPDAQLRAFLKLFLSLDAATVFYVYHGTLDAAVPGRGIVPLMASTSLVRRRVEPQSDGWLVTIWEATVYHREGEDAPLDAFENPLNARTVRPFHQREGGNQSVYTVNGQFQLRDGQRVPPRGGPKPFSREWHRAGDRIWTSRETAGVYAKSPFDPAVWPLEYAGPDLQYSEKTTSSGLVHELADPRVRSASSTYSLNQVMLWWPWLLMGQQPGFLVWNTQGVKLPGLDALAPATRRLIERVHPALLGEAAPWQGYVSLWTEYPKLRKPER